MLYPAPAKIQMVDLGKQYDLIKDELDQAVIDCIRSGMYINGPKVKSFQEALEHYLGVKHVIPCGNGTDALQIALMALDLKPGDEVIVPSFTYVATAEVIALLQLQPVMVDVDPDTFNVTAAHIRPAITSRTRAIVPVHLFGQSADMESIMELAREYDLKVIEDNAQAIGANYCFADGRQQKAGTIGDIGCTSFYPSKNLGCYGDGGAIFTNDDELAKQLRMIANHGQNKRYYHQRIGVNSRLDAIQATILQIKLGHLDQYCERRQQAAEFYDRSFAPIAGLQTPVREKHSSHVFHQYTLKVGNGKRDALKEYLAAKNIPTMIYYPVPLYKQEAFNQYHQEELAVTEELCQTVLSLPIHSEMDEATLGYIVQEVINGVEEVGA